MYNNPYILKRASEYDYAEGKYTTQKPLFRLRPSDANITYTTKDGRTYTYNTENVAAWRNFKKHREEFNRLLESGELTSDDIVRMMTDDAEYAAKHRKHLSTISDKDWNKVFYPLSRDKRAKLSAYKPSKYSNSIFTPASYDLDTDIIATNVSGLGWSNPLSENIEYEGRLTNNGMALFNAMDKDTLKASVMAHELNHAATISSARNRKKRKALAMLRQTMRGNEFSLDHMINPYDSPDAIPAEKEVTKTLALNSGDDVKEYKDFEDDLLSRAKTIDPYSMLASERAQAIAGNTQSLYAAQKLMREHPELYKDFDMNARKEFLSLKAPAKSKKQFVDRMEFFLKHPEFGLLLGEASRLIPVYNELKNLKTVIPVRNVNKGKGFWKELFTPNQRFTDPSLVYEERTNKNSDVEYNMLTDMYYY